MFLFLSLSGAIRDDPPTCYAKMLGNLLITRCTAGQVTQRGLHFLLSGSVFMAFSSFSACCMMQPLVAWHKARNLVLETEMVYPVMPLPDG